MREGSVLLVLVMDRNGCFESCDGGLSVDIGVYEVCGYRGWVRFFVEVGVLVRE